MRSPKFDELRSDGAQVVPHRFVLLPMATVPEDHPLVAVGGVPTAAVPFFVSWIPMPLLGSFEPVVTKVAVMPLIVAPVGMLNPKFVSTSSCGTSNLSELACVKVVGVLPTRSE